MLKYFVPICNIDKSRILCFRNNNFYSIDSKSNIKNYICKFNCSFARRLLMNFRFSRRYFGLNSIRGVKVKSNLFFIYYHHHFYILDISKKQINEIYNRKSYSILHLSSSSIGPLWGEYGYNPSKKPKSIYRYNQSNNKIECLYTFEEGWINHIHNVIEDKSIGRIYILTGDFDNAAGIYYTDDYFTSVKPLLVGNQVFRTCFVSPNEGGLVYATDSPTHINSLYFLKDGIINKISEINGSCIFACKYGNYFIGSTTVENQPSEYYNNRNKYRYNLGHGIKDWNVELFAYNMNTGDYKVLLKASKDILPMLAFGYGLFIIPVLDDEYTGDLLVYGQSVKRYDQYLMKINITI